MHVCYIHHPNNCKTHLRSILEVNPPELTMDLLDYQLYSLCYMFCKSEIVIKVNLGCVQFARSRCKLYSIFLLYV